MAALEWFAAAEREALAAQGLAAASPPARSMGGVTARRAIADLPGDPAAVKTWLVGEIAHPGVRENVAVLAAAGRLCGGDAEAPRISQRFRFDEMWHRRCRREHRHAHGWRTLRRPRWRPKRGPRWRVGVGMIAVGLLSQVEETVRVGDG